MRMPRPRWTPALCTFAALTLAACGQQGTDLERRSATLQAPDASGAEGEVVLTETLTGSRLEFQVVGLPENWYLPQIREGDCDAPGSVVREFDRAGVDATGALELLIEFREPPFSDMARGAVIALQPEDAPGALALCGEHTDAA